MDEQKDLRHYLLYLVSRREYSAKDLKSKLLEKGYSSDLVEQEILHAQEKKWQSDERFAEAFIHLRISQGKGPVRIAFELEQHGVSKILIESFLDYRDKQWSELAKQVLQKKKFVLDSYAEKAKAMKFLQYRGFSIEQINKVIKDD